MVPMAIPSVGGMLIAMMSMFIVPVLYCSMMEWKLKLGIKDARFQATKTEHDSLSNDKNVTRTVKLMTNDDEIHTAAKSTHSDPTVSSHVQMSLKVGVMGGAGADIPAEYLAKASQLGEAIASAGCIVVTGACPGLPMAAARGAKRAGGLVIGISPALSLDEHAFKYESPTLAHDVLIFTGSGLMGREVVNIRSSDIVVIVGGRQRNAR